jgi:hypothetical protein
VATARVTHQVHLGAVNVVVRGPGVRRDMLRRGKRVEAVAKRLVGVDHGALRADISTEPVQRGGVPGARVGSRKKYARVHHDGHKPIVPVRAKVLRFKPKGSRVWVFAKRVKAVKGTKYLTRALPAARG